MIKSLTHLTILVKNQDEALEFYTKKFGFIKHTDAPCGDLRWVTVCPAGNKNLEFCLMLAKPEEMAWVGKQAGENSLGCFETEDFHKTYKELKKNDVQFVTEPEDQPWGIGAVLKDLYGNMFYLCQPKEHC